MKADTQARQGPVRRPLPGAPWKLLLPLVPGEPILAVGLTADELRSLARTWEEIHLAGPLPPAAGCCGARIHRVATRSQFPPPPRFVRPGSLTCGAMHCCPRRLER